MFIEKEVNCLGVYTYVSMKHLNYVQTNISYSTVKVLFA